MYSGDIIWQHTNYLCLIKFITLKFLTLANNFIMSSSSDISSDLASTFIALNTYLDVITMNLDSTNPIDNAVRALASISASPTSTTSTDYFAIIEEVENQTLIKSTCLDIQYSKAIDDCLAEHDATAVGLLINIV
jgi:hypothetical protein